MPSLSPRAATIASRLSEIRSRIAQAAERAGRDPSDVTLIGVTKTFPLEVVEAAIEAGFTDLGESRVQELSAKSEDVPGLVGGGSFRWHLIGPLQRNKVKRAVEIADVIQSVGSMRLANEINKRAEAVGRMMPCYLQVNVSGEDAKSGVKIDEAGAFIREVLELPNIEVIGLMTIPEEAEPEIVRSQFRELVRIADEAPIPLRLSMGMSGDFEIAVEEGATDVRIGTALFGDR